MRVVTMMLMRMAPLTFMTCRTMVRTMPMTNSHRAGWLKVARAGNAGVKADQAHIQHADVCNKQADTTANSILEADRDGLNDVFSDLGDGDQNVDQTADKDHGQSRCQVKPSWKQTV